MAIADPLSDSRGMEGEVPCLACGAHLPSEAVIRGRDRLLGTPGAFAVHVCTGCGSGITLPLVSPEGASSYYIDGYGSHGEPSTGIYARLFAVLKRAQVESLLSRPPFSGALPVTPGRALDVGCARGDLAAGLRARGWTVDGVEPSAAAAALAESRGVNVLGQTLASVALGRDSYDIVVMHHTLEHLPAPREEMRLVVSALRPEGRVIISLPNFASWQRRRLGSRWFHLDLPRHRVHFTPSSLCALVENAGLRVRSQSTSTSLLGLPASVQYAILGRCVAPGGIGLRAATALCCAVFPLTWALDGLGGARDTLHVVAERGR